MTDQPAASGPLAPAALDVEAAAMAIGLNRFRDQKPPVRWPTSPTDTLSARDGTVPLTWDFAERCREDARAALQAAPTLQAARAGEADKRAWIDRWNAIETAADDAVHTMSGLLEAPNLKRLQGRLSERRDSLRAALDLPTAGTAWMRPAATAAAPVSRDEWTVERARKYLSDHIVGTSLFKDVTVPTEALRAVLKASAGENDRLKAALSALAAIGTEATSAVYHCGRPASKWTLVEAQGSFQNIASAADATETMLLT